MKAISHPTTLAGLTVLAALGVVPAHAAFKPSPSRTALFTHTSAHVAPMATPVRVSLHQQDGDHGAPVQVAANAHGDTRDHGDSRDVRAATAVDRIAIGTVSGGSSVSGVSSEVRLNGTSWTCVPQFGQNPAPCGTA